MDKQPVRVQLQNGITAQVDWQPAQQKPFWSFGYVDDDCLENGGGECYQPCMFGGQEPIETIFGGIARYQLPLPSDETVRAQYLEWKRVQAASA